MVQFWPIFYIFGQKVLKLWLRLPERHELFAGLLHSWVACWVAGWVAGRMVGKLESNAKLNSKLRLKLMLAIFFLAALKKIQKFI